MSADIDRRRETYVKLYEASDEGNVLIDSSMNPHAINEVSLFFESESGNASLALGFWIGVLRPVLSDKEGWCPGYIMEIAKGSEDFRPFL